MVTYKNGDLLKSGCKFICHQVNCKGVMGSGIAKQIKETYPEVFNEYKNFCDKGEQKLGSVLVADRIINFFSQDDDLPRGVQHTDYQAFKDCCLALRKYLLDEHSSFLAHNLGVTLDYARRKYLPDVRIGFPCGIGCGLGGGDWEVIDGIINEVFADERFNVEIWKL